MARLTIAELERKLEIERRTLSGVQSDAEKNEVMRNMKRLRSLINRRERDQAMKDLGLVKVRGNLGGTYYE